MFKRFTAIVLAFIYLTVSTGFTMNVHHCMGVLTSISLASHSDCVCKVSGYDLCCKTTLIRVELKDKSQKTIAEAPVFNTLILPAVRHSLNLEALKIVSGKILFLDEGPPHRAGLPEYILFHNFRI